MHTYLINSECGILRDLTVNNIDEAKAIYTEKFGFDFVNVESCPGSWYAIYEDEILVETVNPENAG